MKYYIQFTEYELDKAIVFNIYNNNDIILNELLLYRKNVNKYLFNDWLQIASRYGNIKILKVLFNNILKNKNCKNIYDYINSTNLHNGNTSLIIAAKYNHYKFFIELYKKYLANPNIKNYYNKTVHDYTIYNSSIYWFLKLQ